ncbi:MAG: 4'-phosphopantetheinyl transferase family protein [Flavobacteriales bacterium]
MKGMQTYDTFVEFGSHYGSLRATKFDGNVALNPDLVVYSIHLPDYLHLVKDLTVFLEAFEKERALKYYKEIDKNRFIICRSLLKFALAYHTQSMIKNISIELLPNKKPYLPSHPKLFFNVSHSGDYAIFAIGNAPVGIDIEFIDLSYAFHDVLPHIFNKSEIHYICNANNQLEAFYRLWTRKEAFVKALGKGIDDDFLKIPCLDGLHAIDNSIIGNSFNWQVHNFEMIDKRYLGAIARPINTISNKENLLFLTLPNTLDEIIKMDFYTKK